MSASSLPFHCTVPGWGSRRVCYCSGLGGRGRDWKDEWVAEREWDFVPGVCFSTSLHEERAEPSVSFPYSGK